MEMVVGRECEERGDGVGEQERRLGFLVFLVFLY